MTVISPELLHSKEANAARRERGVKAVAWLLFADGRMEEQDAEDVVEAKRLAEAGVAIGAISTSWRVVGPTGKTKMIAMISPHDDCDWI